MRGATCRWRCRCTAGSTARPVARSTAPLGGVPYVVFVAPALLVSAAVMVGVEESTYQVLGGTQWDAKTYYTIYQAAVSPGQLTLGVLLAIQVRVAAVAGLYWIAMLVFGMLPQPGTGLAIPLVAMLGALAFGAPVAGYFAGLDREGGRSTMVRRFVLMPLVLFGCALASLLFYLSAVGGMRTAPAQDDAPRREAA